MKLHEEHGHDLNIKSVDRLGGTRVRLTVEFPAETVREHEKVTANRYLLAARIPGFRPGKAPLKMVRERYKSEITKDVVSHLLEAGLHEALEKTKLMPVDRPQIQLGEVSLTEGKPFEFKAEFDVEPEIELRHYKGIPLKALQLEVDEGEVFKTLENLRDRFAVLEPLAATQPEKGNFAVIEVGYTLVEEPQKKEAPKQFTVEVGEGKLLPELDTALMEMTVGANREVKSRFPAEYDDKDLAGREAFFDLRLVELKKKVLPETDDAFAAQVKPESTLEGLKSEIRQSIEQAKRDEGDRERRDAIIEYLIKNHSFEVPKSMVEQQTYAMLKSMARDFKEQGIDPSKLSESDFEGFRKRAEQMVRSSLLLREIASKEKLALDEARVRARVEAIAEQLGRSVDETEKFLSGKGMMDRLRDETLTDQVFEFLIQNAEIEKAAGQP